MVRLGSFFVYRAARLPAVDLPHTACLPAFRSFGWFDARTRFPYTAYRICYAALPAHVYAFWIGFATVCVAAAHRTLRWLVDRCRRRHPRHTTPTPAACVRSRSPHTWVATLRFVPHVDSPRYGLPFTFWFVLPWTAHAVAWLLGCSRHTLPQHTRVYTGYCSPGMPAVIHTCVLLPCRVGMDHIVAARIIGLGYAHTPHCMTTQHIRAYRCSWFCPCVYAYPPLPAHTPVPALCWILRNRLHTANTHALVVALWIVAYTLPRLRSGSFVPRT